ncbi:MAG: bifunctional diaminohydroxyphosphoribosylaminopyrimidine deaminase/5-amino-6-(5-phosphoribosylamino)uracil reductase RibD [Bauldia sp.]
MARKNGKKSPPVDQDLDRRMMAAALRLGRRNLGQTYPNPAVGAILVQTDGGLTVVGRGWTAPGGRPHAETIALAEAGDRARGATAYVTLEPCAHTGQTPPCAEALIAAKVSRVVTAIADPDPRVSGKGHAMLHDAGIAVTTGVLAEEAMRAHAGHVSRVTRGRPHVTLKLAVSADGMIGRRQGERMIITSPPSLRVVQAMRAEADAMMIGIGTALVDDPRLNVRLAGMAARSPARIVLDSRARLPLESRLVETARDVALILIVGGEAPADRREALGESGARIVEVATVGGRIDISGAMAELAKQGFTRILAEGGSEVAGSLIAADLLDEVVIFHAPVVVGHDGVRAIAGSALSAIERSPRYRPIETMRIGEDEMRRYLRVA